MDYTLEYEINKALLTFNEMSFHLPDKIYEKIFKTISSCENIEQLENYMKCVRVYCH